MLTFQEIHLAAIYAMRLNYWSIFPECNTLMWLNSWLLSSGKALIVLLYTPHVCVFIDVVFHNVFTVMYFCLMYSLV